MADRNSHGDAGMGSRDLHQPGTNSKRAFAAAWGRLLKETSPARLERAWELERAVEARQRRLEMAGNDSA